MSDTAVTRILVLTDPGHVAAINSALSGTETLYEIRYAVSQQDFIHAFNSADWDLIAASFDYPHGCVEILTWVRHIDPYVPFIILADKETDALSNVVIHHKANDYIIKSNLIRLPALIHRECSRYHQLKKMAGISTSIRTLNAISDAVITTDAHCRIISMNPAAEKLLKLNNAEARGRLLTETVRLLDETSGNQVSCAELVKQQRHTILKIAPPQSSTPHSPCYVEISASELKLDQELQQHYVLVFHDITETRRLLHQLSHDASHDPLTNLINRREFEKRLNRFLNKANPQHCGVLLFFDLDQFKVVNDTSGHHAGDELLRQVANLLRGQVRERDTLARVGGDEFALLMECCDIIQANRIAQNILKTFKQFRFYWPENLFQVGVSIGVIPIDRPNMKLEKVLKLADQACYAAKEAGRNRYILLRDEETNTLQRQTDLRWASLINEALEKNQFQLYQQKIQPIAKHPDGERYEILLRFPDPGSKRTIAPSAFLNSAERYDLLPAIDHWVVSTVLQWLEQHPEQLGKLASCSINLSGRTIGEETHAQRILDLLQASSVPAEKICFEITETAAISCSSLAACHMNAIRNLGCKFALDDFGVGLASFNYLKNLPIDILKIDGSFVLPMLDNPLDHAMVRSINEVGHIMGKQTIAEFVNSRQLLEGLTAIGIDFVQGYHIAKPIPLNGITTLN